MLTFFFANDQRKSISIEYCASCRKVTIFKLSLRETQLANMCGKLCVLPQFFCVFVKFIEFFVCSLLLRAAIIATTTEWNLFALRREKSFRLIVRWNRSNAKEQLITSHWPVKYEKKTSFYVKYLLNFTLNGTPVSGVCMLELSHRAKKRLNYQWSEWKNGCHWKCGMKVTLRAPM